MKTKHRDLQGKVDAGTVGAQHNAQGAEILDDTPVSVPIRFRGKAITSYNDAVNLLQMASRIAQAEGMETEEEANDFFIEGEEDFEQQGSSVFTEQDEKELLEVRKRVEDENTRRRTAGLERKKKKPDPDPDPDPDPEE